MRKIIGLTIACLLTLGACSNDDDGKSANSDHPAAQALRAQIEQLSKGQYGKMYQSLHPEQKKLMTEGQMVACYNEQPVSTSGAKLDKIDEIYTEKMIIPGTDIEVEATAVTAKVSLRGMSETNTFHEIKVGDTWTWTYSGLEECIAGE